MNDDEKDDDYVINISLTLDFSSNFSCHRHHQRMQLQIFK